MCCSYRVAPKIVSNYEAHTRIFSRDWMNPDRICCKSGAAMWPVSRNAGTVSRWTKSWFVRCHSHFSGATRRGAVTVYTKKKKKLKPNVPNGNPPWLLSGLGVVLLSPKTQVQSRPWWPLFRWRSKAKTPTCGDFGARFRSPGGQNWSGALHNDAPHSQGVASAR